MHTAHTPIVSHLCPHLCAPSDTPPIALRAPLHRIYQYMPKHAKVYCCNCQRYCNGINRVVGRKTYFTHRTLCDPHSKFSQQYQDFLDKYPILPNLLSDVLWSSQIPPAQTTEATDGPLSQRTCQTTDLGPSNDGRILVGASLYL
jgi:hypothetical protein